MMIKRIGIILYYIIFTVIYGGFVLHKSVRPEIFQYSMNYLFFLLLLSPGFLIPPVVHILIKKYGVKHLVFAILPAIIFFIISYGLLSVRYYYTQEHHFDPYLQKPPPQIDARLAEKKNNFRILAIGGSTTQNTDLEQKDRYPEVLQKLLREYYQTSDIDVFNAGKGWYTTKHSLINYVTNLGDWQPNLVIIMHAINDLYRSFSPPNFALGRYDSSWSHFYGPAINGADPPTFEEHLFGKYAFAWYSQLRRSEKDLPLERYYSLKDFEKNLVRLVYYVKSDNVPVILITQPSLYKPNMNAEEISSLRFGWSFCLTRHSFFREEYPSAQSLYYAMQAFNDVTRKVARRENLMLVDLEKHIAKNLDNFLDDVHYTTQGSRQVASIVAQQIIDAGYVMNVESMKEANLGVD